MLVVSISDLIDAPTPKACYASDQFLHLPAGSSDIAELRGTLHFVSCFSLTTTSILPRSFCYDHEKMDLLLLFHLLEGGDIQILKS